MQRGELLFRGACVLFFVALFPRAWGLGEVRRFGEVGSGFWPLLVLLGATGVSLALLLRGLWSASRQRGPRDRQPPSSGGFRRSLPAIGVVLAYLLVVPWLGFLPSTSAFVALFMLVLGERRGLLLATAPLLIALGVFLFFIKFIQLPLPRGSGAFLTFSRLFY